MGPNLKPPVRVIRAEISVTVNVEKVVFYILSFTLALLRIL